MRRPAVFFDRDNTLIIGNDYLGDPAGVVLVAGAPAAVATCRELGFAVVVVSNQSGVARGMFDEDAVRSVNARMDELLLAANPSAVIDRHEYCPHHPQGTAAGYAFDCECRKPKPGMVLRAADAMALDVAASWMVGDAPRDIAAGQAAGCRTILIIDKTLAPSPAAKDPLDRPADFVVGSLVEAVDVILQDTNRPGAVYPHADDATLPADPEPAAPPPEPAPQPEAAAYEPTPPSETPSARFSVIEEAMPIEVTAVATPEPQHVPVAMTPSLPIAAAFQAIRPEPLPPKPPEPTAPPETPATKVDLARLEMTSQQILMELKKLNDIRHDDFSISKLIAGIVQTLALAALPVSYVLYRNETGVLLAWLMTAIFLQVFTIALLVMGRQR